jgi:hypothetical protein
MMMNSSKNQLDGYETGNTSTSQNKGGENSHTKLGREMHIKYNPGQSYIKEYKLPSGKRADAVSFEKLILSKERAEKILNGVFENYGYRDGTYRVYNEQEFWGIGESVDGVLKIKAYVR